MKTVAATHQPILKGDLIKIKHNVESELARMKFISPTITNDLIDTTQTALDVYEADKEQFNGASEWFVTIKMCCEIPLAACQLYARPALSDRAKTDKLFWRKHEGLDLWELASERFYNHEKRGSDRRFYGGVSLKDLFGDNPERGTGYSTGVVDTKKAKTKPLADMSTLAEAMQLVESSYNLDRYFF